MYSLVLLLLSGYQDGFVVRPITPVTPVPATDGFVTKPPKKPEKSILKPKAPIYKHRTRWITAPGYQYFNWEGNWRPTKASAVSHLQSNHSTYLPEKINLSNLTMQELDAIHSMIHSIEFGLITSRTLGYWEQACPTDGGPCVFTFVFQLPQ